MQGAGGAIRSVTGGLLSDDDRREAGDLRRHAVVAVDVRPPARTIIETRPPQGWPRD